MSNEIEVIDGNTVSKQRCTAWWRWSSGETVKLMMKRLGLTAVT